VGAVANLTPQSEAKQWLHSATMSKTKSKIFFTDYTFFPVFFIVFYILYNSKSITKKGEGIISKKRG
jgi:hypothetical protein